MAEIQIPPMAEMQVPPMVEIPIPFIVTEMVAVPELIHPPSSPKEDKETIMKRVIGRLDELSTFPNELLQFIFGYCGSYLYPISCTCRLFKENVSALIRRKPSIYSLTVYPNDLCVDQNLFYTRWLYDGVSQKGCDGSHLMNEACVVGFKDVMIMACAYVEDWRFTFAFWLACKYNHLDCAKWLHAHGKVNMCDALEGGAKNNNLEMMDWANEEESFLQYQYRAALDYAALNGHLMALVWAHDHGATDYGLALRWAADGGHLQCIKCLIQYGASNLEEALGNACGNNHEACVEWLHSIGVVCTKYPYARLCANGTLRLIKLLYPGDHILHTAFSAVCRNTDLKESLRCARWLWDKGVGHFDEEGLNYGIDSAVIHGNLDVLKLIHEGKPEYFEHEGFSAPRTLDKAAQYDRPRCIGFLLAVCASQLHENDKNLALRTAALNGHVECLTVLCENGATDFDGIFNFAFSGGSISGMAFAVEKGVSVAKNAINHFFSNACIRRYQVQEPMLAIQWVYDHGATDLSGLLVKAAKIMFSDLVTWLCEHGAKGVNVALLNVIRMVPCGTSERLSCIQTLLKYGAWNLKEAYVVACEREAQAVMEYFEGCGKMNGDVCRRLRAQFYCPVPRKTWPRIS